MAEASLISTVIAIGMIPAGVLFVYSFLSGLKKWRFHNVAGAAAVLWDLGLSMGYFINRALGPATSSTYSGAVRAYLAVHGTVSAVVIAIELCVLATGLYNWKSGKKTVWHGRLSKALFAIWWFSFISGEIFYLVNYVL